MTPQDRLAVILLRTKEGVKDDFIAAELGVDRHYIAVTRSTLGIENGWKQRKAERALARKLAYLKKHKLRNPLAEPWNKA